MKNILVAVRFDKSCQRLVDQAADFARKFSAKIWLIHIAAPDPDFVGYEPGPQYIRDDRAQELRHEHQELQELANALSLQGLVCEALLVQGPTVKTILEEANRLQADLLIVGTQEHGFMHNLFSESTSLELFKKTNIPLLTIPIEVRSE